MRKIAGTLFAASMMLAASGSIASAGNMMMDMMQCSASCSTQYMQCVANANQLASTPQEGLTQLQSNFQGSTQCTQDAMNCQASCR